ncbi:MAG: histidine ammonia-lyase [Clostridiales bacterium]|nr:histidine ammonia-lyase [Clostridiales bacterium]
MKVLLNGNDLTIDEVIKVARNNAEVGLTEEAISKMVKSRELVDEFVDGNKVVYGITTGFGKFSDVFISKEEAAKLQRNLIISHACGVGNPFAEEIVRAVMLLRVNAIAKGLSGVRVSTINTLVEMINKRVHPVIPEKGSLGASGDLAPLSHMVLVMIGEGEAYFERERMSGKEAMTKAGINTIELTSKEGLGLINGTQVMTAIGALAVYDAKNLMKALDISAALTVEALHGITDPFKRKIHEARPHRGQLDTAENMMNILDGSGLTCTKSENENEVKAREHHHEDGVSCCRIPKVQDAYTIRCIPQIHGASKDAIVFVKNKINIEINSATDNPLIFADDKEVISCGNFHGQPIALAFDFLGIAISEIANVSERRIERLVNPQLSGLPAFLTEKGGLNSGFMIAQYSAAALVSENKTLAHPASVDSIPSSANQEDHVSMGTIAARKAREILYNATRVVGIELIVAAQALEFSDTKKLGVGTAIAYKEIRKAVTKLNEDRVMYCDINKSVVLIENNTVVEAVEKEIGSLRC